MRCDGRGGDCNALGLQGWQGRLQFRQIGGVGEGWGVGVLATLWCGVEGGGLGGRRRGTDSVGGIVERSFRIRGCKGSEGGRV